MAGIRQIGDWIDDRFEVYDVHTGGMGVVYVVYDHQGASGRRVAALKTLRDEFLGDDRLIRRFISECETWVRLERHPNIVRAYSVHRIEGKPYVLLELITGGDLRQWIGTPRLDLPQALRFGIQFCLGFEYALRKGLHCHRDIKPENLMVTEGGTLKITDFGLAKVRDMASEDDPFGGAIPLVEILEVEPIPDLGEVSTEPDPIAGAAPEPAPGAVEVVPGGADAPGRAAADPIAPVLSSTEIDPVLTADPYGPTIDWPPPQRGGQAAARPPVESRPGPSGGPEPGGAAAGPQDPGRPCSEITRAGQLLGTALYCAPEQFRAAESVDWHADLYAFGIVLFEMITGHRPFQGKTLGVVKRQHAHEPPPSVIPWIPHRYRFVARRIDRIVQRCLKKNPEQRFRSIAELRTALSRCLRQLTGEEVAVPPETELEAWEFTSKGLSMGVLGRYAEELECYDRATRSSTGHLPAWFNRAAALGDLGRWDEALEAAEVALSLNPQSIPALLNKGMALHALGRSDEALDPLDEAIALRPLDPEAWYCRGVVRRDRGDRAGARSDLLHALQLRPTFVEALDALQPGTDRRPGRPGGPRPSSPGDPHQEQGTGPIRGVRRAEDSGPEGGERGRPGRFRFW